MSAVKYQYAAGLLEVFIQLRDDTMEDFERALEVIEEIPGRVLQAYPPSVIVALVPVESLTELPDKVEADLIATGEIDNADVHDDKGVLGFAVTAWNEHLRSDRVDQRRDVPRVGRSWDAPGMQPPDIPPAIAEMLRWYSK